MYLYLNTILTKVFTIVFVYGKFIVFVFVFKYYAMYLDPSVRFTCIRLMYVCTKTIMCGQNQTNSVYVHSLPMAKIHLMHNTALTNYVNVDTMYTYKYLNKWRSDTTLQTCVHVYVHIHVVHQHTVFNLWFICTILK